MRSGASSGSRDRHISVSLSEASGISQSRPLWALPHQVPFIAAGRGLVRGPLWLGPTFTLPGLSSPLECGSPLEWGSAEQGGVGGRWEPALSTAIS